MTTDDNDDAGTDFLGFYSGEAASGNKPELVITYTLTGIELERPGVRVRPFLHLPGKNSSCKP